MPLWQEVVKLSIEHADYVAGLIVDNLFLLEIIEDRDGEATFVLRIRIEVDISQVSKLYVDWIRPDILARHLVFFRSKVPS